MLAKLGPVAGKLNFYQSSSSYTVFEDSRWRTREVQNYKDPSEVQPVSESGDTAKKLEAERAQERKKSKRSDADVESESESEGDE
jgi:hypothetical protein